MLNRLRALVIKEILALVRDPRSRIVLIMPPLVQLFIFSFAATLEVRNNALAIWNEDTGPASAELVQRIGSMGAFEEVRYVHDETAFNHQVDYQKSLLGIHIPHDFTSSLAGSSPVSIQVVVDGKRSTSGQIALGYLAEVLESFQADRMSTAPAASGQISVHHWFNPNLHYFWFVVPSLVAILTTIMTMIVTALSLARERELGTFEQLMVSPLTPAYILAGKAIPAFFVAMAEASLIVFFSVFVFKIPLHGSVLLLYLTMAFYILSLVGIGLFISALCSTQQQAILGVFSFVLPAILLSGFAGPVDNMPEWLARLTVANPLLHFKEICKGIFLKDISIQAIWGHTWPMLLMAVLNTMAALAIFRRKFS